MKALAEAERRYQDWTPSFASRTRAGVGAGIAAIMAFSSATDVISLAGGFPDPATFPQDTLPEAMRDLLAQDPSALGYSPTAGLASTREYLASRLEDKEGRAPEPEELLVTSGAIEAMELVAKTFLDPGDLAVLEGPTFLGAIMAFRGFEARVEAVAMDAEGLRTDDLERMLRRGARPKIVYTIPDHQNPEGVSLSLERRHHLVELAARYGFLLFEDVAYRELSFDGPALPSLWTLAPDVVVQAGTFSKLFFPGVRLGWAVGPPQVVQQLVLAKQNTDQCAGALGQRLLEWHGRRGLLDERIRAACALYRTRRDLLLDALEREMPEGVSWTRPAGGFFSWLTLDGDVDAVDLASRALDRGVVVVPGPVFFPDGRGRRNVRLAYSRVEDDHIATGVGRLAEVFSEALGGS